MTLDNIQRSCCFQSSIDIKNMFGEEKEERENTIDEHNIERDRNRETERERERKSKQSVRHSLSRILLPLLLLAVAQKK